MNAPLILTADAKTEAASSYMTEKTVEEGVVLGGTGALTDEAVRTVFGLDANAEILIK